MTVTTKAATTPSARAAGADVDAPPGPLGRMVAGPAAMVLAFRAAPGMAALLAVVSVCAGAGPVASAWLTKLLLDRIAERTGSGLAELVRLAVALAVVGVLLAFLPQLVNYASAELGRRVRLAARDRIFTTVGNLPGLVRLEDPPFYDRLMLAHQAGADSPGQVLGGLLGLLQAILTMGGFLVTMALLSPVMTVALLLAAIPALVAELMLNRRRARLAWRLGPTERREIFYADLLRNLQAAKEVRLFGTAGFFRDRMLVELRTINGQRRRLDRRVLGTQGGLSLLSATLAGAGLVWAATAALSGRLSIGDVAIFVAAVAGTQGSLAGAVRNLSVVHEALLMFGHYHAVIATPPDLPVPADPRPVPPLRQGIEFQDVWFRYGDDQPWILRGVDLTIGFGTAAALVGENGAGKSTMVKLLCRLYDPTRGRVLWDGVDLREFDPASLRERMSTVFQDYTCYDLSARENIALGDLSAIDDQTRLTAAARRAGAHDAISRLPKGYDTLLSRMFRDPDVDDPKGGVLLSGGQWQRLALARAFLRDQRDLLILDEPSSGLDAEAEYEIHARLRAHREGQTSLLISHRLGTLRDASQIAVLDGGRITELGGHQELLAVGGTYARLFALQSTGYRGAD
ncbi:putative multidrug export ATP-binding/permease protein [Micromonospora sp. MW-13]|uniref:ABC transporter ATP-binding protein n=1 Tax=Micromonospora sp. MW-13 TaxID=2094022 RepID=UPI000EE02AAC|nr:ABC transporter ATP-binding protein [Micromonospora sp. MW-13]RGC69380.1 putative multidrug export ATP-binding/permease protein [Micromonospora sp. MW-13]